MEQVFEQEYVPAVWFGRYQVLMNLINRMPFKTSRMLSRFDKSHALQNISYALIVLWHALQNISYALMMHCEAIKLGKQKHKNIGETHLGSEGIFFSRQASRYFYTHTHQHSAMLTHTHSLAHTRPLIHRHYHCSLHAHNQRLHGCQARLQRVLLPCLSFFYPLSIFC